MDRSKGWNPVQFVTHDIVIRPEAEADISDAYQWYEKQRKGLGSDFLLCIEATLDSIQRNPKLYQVIHHEVRRAFIRRFPYGIFYLLEDDHIVVLAVFHVRRDPRSWPNH